MTETEQVLVGLAGLMQGVIDSFAPGESIKKISVKHMEKDLYYRLSLKSNIGNDYHADISYNKETGRDIVLTNGEILPLFDGHLARFLTEKNGQRMVLEIPIPAGKYEKYQLFDKIRILLCT